MSSYDFNRPFVESRSLPLFHAIDPEVAAQFGALVRATDMSNAEYATRHSQLAKSNNMKPPPSHLRIFPGYLVVRKIDQAGQYETWMPEHVFAELYERK